MVRLAESDDPQGNYVCERCHRFEMKHDQRLPNLATCAARRVYVLYRHYTADSCCIVCKDPTKEMYGLERCKACHEFRYNYRCNRTDPEAADVIERIGESDILPTSDRPTRFCVNTSCGTDISRYPEKDDTRDTPLCRPCIDRLVDILPLLYCANANWGGRCHPCVQYYIWHQTDTTTPLRFRARPVMRYCTNVN